jgi:DNA replication protein DnaC
MTSPAKSKSSSSASADPGLPGDPNCPLCAGLGYLRRDLPVGDPDFGKATICDCRRQSVTEFVRSRLFSISRLDELKDLTFNTFKPRGKMNLGALQVQSLEWAFSHSRQYASSLKGWLLLQGGYGSGKTHLAAAIANFAVQMGVPTLFLTVPDLLDTLRFAYDSADTTFEQRFEQIRGAELLVLDDFGTQNATGWAQEKLFQIINYRYINKLPLVVTTNLGLDEIDARIRSRLQDPDLVTTVKITAPDFRNPMDDIGHSQLSSLDLLSNRTFANFEERAGEDLKPDELKSLHGALKLAQAFARNPHGWMVFTGPYGCGKTHLAAAIANHHASLGAPPLFVMIPDLLDHLRAAFSPNSGTSYDRRFDEVRTAPLLVLDDLGSQSTTPWAREKLYQLLNYRYNRELPTVITVPVDLLKDVDIRIQTRILDKRLCEVVEITAPAYSGSKKKPARGRPAAYQPTK